MAKIYEIYFSPHNTTKIVASSISREFSDKVETINLLNNKKKYKFEKDDVIIATMPVFAGRIPAFCAKLLADLSGNGANVVIGVVYGNRDYDDALIELFDIMKSQNFRICGAGAFVAEHSIFTKVATARPDKKDIEKIKFFARGCKENIKKGMEIGEVKGNRPYKDIKNIPLKPKANWKCTKCGLCVGVCPVGAISKDYPKETDKSRCISCTSCISACPHKARSFGGFLFMLASRAFYKKFNARKEPEFFL